MTTTSVVYQNQARPVARDRIGVSATLFHALLWVQGLYYLATGIWPLVSIRTFQMVTGEKTDHLITGREGDHWLVMTVAVLIIAIAVALLAAAWRRHKPPEMALLAIAAAVGLTAIDVVYVGRQVIAPIYLADAVAEVVLIIAWACALLGGLRNRSERGLSTP